MRWPLIATMLASYTSTVGATDLLDTYRQALANDPTLSQADASRRVAKENVAQRRALLLPQVNASLGMNQVQSTGSDGHTRSRKLQGQLSQPIVDTGRIANLRAARSQLSAQDATYEAALQSLVTRLATAYFNVLTSDDALTFARANEQALSYQRERASLRFDVGLSAIIDVQDAKAQHDTAVAQVVTAQNTLADAREALTQITGAPADNLKKLREDLPMDPPSPNDAKAWVDMAVQASPTITAAQYTVAAAEDDVRAARSGHLPTLESSASYERTSAWNEEQRGVSAPPPDNWRGQSRISLSLRLPVYAGGATQSRVRQSQHERNASRNSLEATRRGLVRDTLNYFRSAVAGIDKIKATRAAVSSAQSARDATQAGLDVGTRTIVDLLIAQQTLTRAQSNYSLARHQFVLDKLLLKQVAGRINSDDISAVNDLLGQSYTDKREST